MDKRWMDLPRSSKEYHFGLKYFLDFAFSNSNGETILCPFKKCKNAISKKRSIVEEHILWNGFLSGYTKWVLHGELASNGDLAEECLSFCSLYFDERVETRHNRASRNDNVGEENEGGINIFSLHGCPLWRGKPIVLDNDRLTRAHRYVLFNCDDIKHYMEEHEKEVRRKKHRSREHEIKRIHSDSFASWFKGRVEETIVDHNDDPEMMDIVRLARGPVPVALDKCLPHN